MRIENNRRLENVRRRVIMVTILILLCMVVVGALLVFAEIRDLTEQLDVLRAEMEAVR